MRLILNWQNTFWLLLVLTCTLLDHAVVAVVVVRAFSCPSSRRPLRRQTSRHQTRQFFTENPADKVPFTKPIVTNFWGTIVDKTNSGEDASSRQQKQLPCVPTLDKDGALPNGAYFSHGDPARESKEACRLGVAIHVPALRRTLRGGELSPLVAVDTMQTLIDSGLTSFQIKATTTHQDHERWAEEQIYGRLRQETPSFVMNQCQLTIPLTLPSENSATGATASSVRKGVLDTLSRVGGEAIDCLQVQYNKRSPYLFDTLEVLEDLKREGLVRSVSGRNIPPLTIRSAKNYGFTLDSNQVDANLLEPSAYSPEHRLLCQDLDMPLFLSSPLAGGLLTDRYVGRESMPKLWEFRLAERRQWNSNLHAWADRQGFTRDKLCEGDEWLWDAYQSKLMATLQEISQRHGVSIASVLLRWTLQLDHVASAIVTCRLANPDDGLKRKRREHELREVFRFRLDDEDMKELWEVSGRNEPQHLHGDFDEDEEFFRNMEENENGLLLPETGRGSQKLWL